MKPQRPAPDQLSLSPRVPRVDIEPLALTDPAAAPVPFVVCPVCGGNRHGLGCEEYGWRPCTVCGGQGQIGGGK